MTRNLSRDWLADYPSRLTGALAAVSRKLDLPVYVAGGAVRDWLAGRNSRDLDIALARNGVIAAKALAVELGATLVPLDDEQGVARVVWQGFEIDFSDFREGTTSIEADLARRDFTINAMAVAFDNEHCGLLAPFRIIDPTDGSIDYDQGVIRITHPQSFVSDPLRLLRAYRFAASLGFTLAEATEQRLTSERGLLGSVAMERVAYELELIMASPRAADTVAQMVESGLLWIIFPELRKGEGMDQPSSHHLDVFAHNHLALQWLEALLDDPARYFPGHGEAMAAYLARGKRPVRLKWAALFHDLGKPDCHRIRDGRITFYNHDQEGARQFAVIGRRLRWSREAIKEVSRFIELHMWPFHLNNARNKTGITPRACLRLVRAVGEELPGLFLLAMADSLAGEGPGKPAGMERQLAELYDQVYRVWQESIRPVLEQPRLLNGHDLIEGFGLASGPALGKILNQLEAAQVAGEVNNRAEAEAWVTAYLASGSDRKNR